MHLQTLQALHNLEFWMVLVILEGFIPNMHAPHHTPTQTIYCITIKVSIKSRYVVLEDEPFQNYYLPFKSPDYVVLEDEPFQNF